MHEGVVLRSLHRAVVQGDGFLAQCLAVVLQQLEQLDHPHHAAPGKVDAVAVKLMRLPEQRVGLAQGVALEAEHAVHAEPRQRRGAALGPVGVEHLRQFADDAIGGLENQLRDDLVAAQDGFEMRDRLHL